MARITAFPLIFTMCCPVLPIRLKLYIGNVPRHSQTTPTIAVCLTKFSDTTPYQKQKSLKNLNATNAVTMAYNAIAAEILAPKGFHVVNAYDMMESRDDLTHDGVHYTGPGSKWITNAILNIICPTTISSNFQ